MIFAIFIGLSVVYALSLIFDVLVKWNAPPAPMRLPIVGNLPQIMLADRHTHVALQKLAKKYGDVMQLKLGLCEIVVISSYEAAKTICSMDSVINRMLTSVIATRSFGKPIGIIVGSGDLWKTSKRFAIRNLRDYGFGKSGTMESVIHEQADELMDRIAKEMEQSGYVYMKDRFSIPIINVLWGMVAGETFPQDCEKLLRLLEIQNSILQGGEFASGLSLSFPFLTRLFPNATGVTDCQNKHDILHNFLKETMDSHLEKLKYKNKPDSFIDTLLLEIEKNKKSGHSKFDEQHGIVMLMDFFEAGSESTNSTLTFLLLYAVRFSLAQTRIHEEIDSVLTAEEKPTLDDIDKFPYTRAFIVEVMRHATIIQATPPRMSYEDITYNNYVIKKDMPILVNLHAILHDEAVYGDPSNFRPERFLTTDGKLNVKMVDRVGSFGFGQRLCIGQRVGETLTFLFFTKICQKFEFKTVPGDPLPSIEPVIGFTFSPKPCHLVLQLRQKL